MDQREKKINALFEDNRFVDWVINPQSPYAEYWLQWTSASKENAALAEEARQFLLDVRAASQDTRREAGPETIDGMWDHIGEAIAEHNAGSGGERVPDIRQAGGSKRIWPIRRMQWMAAATMAGLIVLLGLLIWQRTSFRLTVVARTEQTPVSSELVRFNESDKNELVFLPDGSKVTLAKGARISYNRLMNGQRRDVTLSGEAFFDVAKNTQKPFFIYTQNMVVRVLGTSFRVVALPQKETVMVRTGRVSVSLKGLDSAAQVARIILPRQACSYSSREKGLVTTANTGTTKIEMEAEGAHEYVFEDAPIDTVFKTLEKMYDLPVLYDHRTFENCFITISLGNERLEEKLEVITQTINASYLLSDKGINIGGKGCK
ncbi:MAG: hypothetical protein BGO55_10340 [Sphingobacteriales bacterium 50-39]|nr:FecR family protein [Sphingobacteriales bacterium]OJW54107.1 MAG: hypothetical protein BGO55_10340 [Sphingobacteriales bacterium 50-39]